MSLKDRIEQKLDSTGDTNVTRDLLPSDYQRELSRFLERERIQGFHHEIRKGHYLEIGLSPQRMTAYLSLCVFRDKPPLSRQDIMKTIAAAGVCSGLVQEELNRHMRNGEFKTSFIGAVVARGAKPMNGRAGFVELMRRPFDPRHPNALVAFDPVNEDEEIARVHPPEKGTPGVDVLGEEIPCSMSVEAEYKLNHLIKSLSLGNEISLVAGARGHILQDGNSLALQEVLRITHDLKPMHGALNYNNDVEVRGDIFENAALNIDGNLTVEGIVRSVQMRVSKDLTLSHGIFGRGGARITVKGAIRARFINEATVQCDGPVEIAKECLNSELWGKSRVESPAAAFMGGRTFAHDLLEANALGSEGGIPGLVVAGLDYNEYRLETELKPRLKELEERCANMFAEFKQSTPMRKKQIQEQLNTLATEVKNRRGEVEVLQHQVVQSNPAAVIRVHGAVYPGQKLMIGFTELPIIEKIPGPVEFFLRDKGIVTRRLPRA